MFTINLLRFFIFSLPRELHLIFFRISGFVLRRFKIEILVETFFGAKISCELWDDFDRSIALFGVWEPTLSLLMFRSLKPGDVFVDVGANIGYFTSLASRLVTDFGHVHAFEPVPATLKKFKNHSEINYWRNVTIKGVALGAKPDLIKMNLGPEFSRAQASAVYSFADSAIFEVASETMDSQIILEHCDKIRFIKIDVEGYEFDVCKGMVDILSKLQPSALVVIEIGYNENEKFGSSGHEIQQLFLSLGFEMWLIPNDYRGESYFGKNHVPAPIKIDQIPPIHCDVLFCRAIDPEILGQWPEVTVSQLRSYWSKTH